jgi:hypothetical protein
MRYLSYVIAGALLALLVACGSQPTGGAAQPTQPAVSPAPAAPTAPPEATAGATAEPTSAPVPSATANPGATAMPTTAASDVLLVFHRSGGIAGIDETMTIYADGRLELNGNAGKKTGQVAPDNLAELRKLLSSPEFAALEPRYQAMGADLFVYELTVPGGAKPQKVVTMDGANNPAILSQTLEELRKLREQVR